MGTKKHQMLTGGVCIILIAAAVMGTVHFLHYKQNTELAASSGTSAMTGMLMPGDSSKRFTVSLVSMPEKPQPNQNAELKFKVYDADSGEEIKDFDQDMTKLMHLVVVNSNLTYFSHIHPDLAGSEFSITTRFPASDVYHLYIQFQPKGAQEQQFAFALPVGQGSVPSQPIEVDSNLTKTFGDYTVRLSTADNSPFSAARMNNSSQILNFRITDSKTGNPITDIQPYLGAFGHLVMINQSTFKYLHVHPITFGTVESGPDIQFLPMSMYGKVEPGVYRVFGQFQRNDKLFVADFTIEIKP